jgi:hypothetical protein
VTYPVGKKAGHLNKLFKKRFGSLKKLSYLYEDSNKVVDWFDQKTKLRIFKNKFGSLKKISYLYIVSK